MATREEIRDAIVAEITRQFAINSGYIGKPHRVDNETVTDGWIDFDKVADKVFCIGPGISQ